MPQLDPTTFSPQVAWLAITFIVLLLVMWKLVVPRISGVLDARQRRMDENLSRAAELKAEAEVLLEAYEASMAAARQQAQAAIAEVTAEAADEAARQHASLGETLAARIAEGEAAIAKARDEALSSLREVAADVAVSATERLIGERLAAGAVADAVDAAMATRE